MTQQGQRSDQEIIRRMLEAAGRRAPKGPRPDEPEAVEYDWQTPRRYLARELATLEGIAAAFGTKISGAMTELLRTAVVWQPTGVWQHYAGRLRALGDEQVVYSVEVSASDGSSCGLVALPADVAGAWVARLLGSTPTSGDHQLFALETDLVLDILGAVAQGISSGSQDAGGPPLAHKQEIRKGCIALPGNDTDEYTRFTFSVSAFDEQSDAFVLIRSETVDQILGVRHAESGRGPEQTRQDLLAHLRGVPIGATLRLGRAPVTMRDVMALEVGDVVVLERQIAEPVEVVVQDEVVLFAHPVVCGDRYAAEIVSWADSQAPSARTGRAQRAAP